MITLGPKVVHVHETRYIWVAHDVLDMAWFGTDWLTLDSKKTMADPDP